MNFEQPSCQQLRTDYQSERQGNSVFCWPIRYIPSQFDVEFRGRGVEFLSLPLAGSLVCTKYYFLGLVYGAERRSYAI